MEQNGNYNLTENLKTAIALNDTQAITNITSVLGENYILDDEDNEPLILYAISDGNSDAYKTILKFNPNLNVFNNEGEGLVHSIVFSGKKNRLFEVPNLTIFQLNHQAFDGSTSLILSISLEKFDIAFDLIQLGADINLEDEDGLTPIHMASMTDNYELIKLLIHSGANLWKKTNSGNLPLALAVNHGNQKIIEFIYNSMFK